MERERERDEDGGEGRGEMKERIREGRASTVSLMTSYDIIEGNERRVSCLAIARQQRRG